MEINETKVEELTNKIIDVIDKYVNKMINIKLKSDKKVFINEVVDNLSEAYEALEPIADLLLSNNMMKPTSDKKQNLS